MVPLVILFPPSPISLACRGHPYVNLWRRRETHQEQLYPSLPCERSDRQEEKEPRAAIEIEEVDEELSPSY